MAITSTKSFLLPGGAVLLAAWITLESGLVPISSSAVNFSYAAVFLAGFLLAWRFNSSRILFSLTTLLLAHHALVFFSNGRTAVIGPGRVAFDVLALLVPANLIIFSLLRERGLVLASMGPRLVFLFFESTFVAILCRPSAKLAPALFRSTFLGDTLSHWTKIPHLALLVFLSSLGFFLYRWLENRRAVESGMFWTTTAVCMSFQHGGLSPIASAFVATSGLVLVASMIENSYALAYQDELTTLPSRRAFNEALLRLEAPYTIAVVDIDHFKSFNDQYGHDTGDQVLRLVAAKLDRVTGGGKSFRVGGEEFNILFRGTTASDAEAHLEFLRKGIEQSSFRVRGAAERRTELRGPDRRIHAARKTKKKVEPQPMVSDPDGGLRVTVSIGLAEATSKDASTEFVIEEADKALYRAKRSGRNRVESASRAPVRRPRRRMA